MTTFQVEEDQALADALTLVIAKLGPHRAGVAAACEMRAAALPGSGFTTASVPWAARPAVAGAMRSVAADGHPLAARLGELAAGLDELPPHLR